MHLFGVWCPGSLGVCCRVEQLGEGRTCFKLGGASWHCRSFSVTWVCGGGDGCLAGCLAAILFSPTTTTESQELPRKELDLVISSLTGFTIDNVLKEVFRQAHRTLKGIMALVQPSISPTNCTLVRPGLSLSLSLTLVVGRRTNGQFPSKRLQLPGFLFLCKSA